MSAAASGSSSLTESIKASLKSHNESFDQLLRIIPAVHYLRNKADDAPAPAPLTKSQKKAARKAAADGSAAAAKSQAKREAKLARYDPDTPRTIPEIQAAALEKGKAKAASSADSEDWEDDEDEDESANESDFADSDDEDATDLALVPRGADEPAPTVAELRARLQQRIADIQANKRKGGAGAAGVDGAEQSKEDLLEASRLRRAQLREKRNKRKADSGEKKERVPSNGRKGGGKANAAPREEREDRFGNRPTAPHLHDDYEARPNKKSRSDEADKSFAVVPASKEIALASPAPAKVKAKAVVKAGPVDPSALTFSTLDFSTSALLAAQDPKKLKRKNRHDLPKDAEAALKVLAARKEKLEALDPEKREKAEDKARWEKVELKASGEKVRDDEKRLKKMAKRQERVKSKSAKAWAERKETVASNISSKIAKRNANLAARVKAGKDKKAGIKPKSTKPAGKTKSKSHAGRVKSGGGGRAGFEGKGKKK